MKLPSRWTVVATKGPGISNSWLPNKFCPTGQDHKALAALRVEVDEGKYFMAQRRVAPFEYELLITRRMRR